MRACELDATVEDIVARLLKRPCLALAWKKWLVNWRIAALLNTSLDASAADEIVNFLQLERLGWEDPKTLEEPESLGAGGG